MFAFFDRPNRLGGNDLWWHRTAPLPVLAGFVLDRTIEKLAVGSARADE